MKRMIWLLSGLVLVATLVALVCSRCQDRAFVRIPMSRDSYGNPEIEVDLGQECARLLFDTGSEFPLTLASEIRKRVPTRTHGVIVYLDFVGNRAAVPTFEVPRIVVGGVSFRAVIANERTEEMLFSSGHIGEPLQVDRGSVGIGLWGDYNLLLDFAQDQIFLCRNEEALEKHGIDLEKMVRCDMPEGRLPIVSVGTDVGERRMILDSGCSFNLVHEDLISEELEPDQDGLGEWTSSKLIVGSTDLGRTEFHTYPFSRFGHSIDAILGMPFLEEHLVYLDLRNRVVYIGDPKCIGTAE